MSYLGLTGLLLFLKGVILCNDDILNKLFKYGIKIPIEIMWY